MDTEGEHLEALERERLEDEPLAEFRVDAHEVDPRRCVVAPQQVFERERRHLYDFRRRAVDIMGEIRVLEMISLRVPLTEMLLDPTEPGGLDEVDGSAALGDARVLDPTAPISPELLEEDAVRLNDDAGPAEG